MVRPFPRKSERRGSHLSGQDEQCSETSSSNEISPASLWGLDEDISFRSKANSVTSGNAPEVASLDNVKWYDHPDYQQPLRSSGSQARNREPGWWAKPNLMEEADEITKTESSEDHVEIPSLNEPQIGPESVAMTDEDDLNEDTLITQPVTATAILESETYGEPQQLVPVEEAEAIEEEIPSRPEKKQETPIRVLDESAELPSEASYATVRLAEPEKRPRVLDESTILPSEASFATVRLAGPVKSPRVLDESTILPSEASYASVALNKRDKPRSRVLDDSAVLPNEASFATVPLYKSSSASYSPGSEFVRKVASGMRRSFPIVLLVAVCAAVVVFSVKYKDAIGLSDSGGEPQASHSLAADPQVKPVTKTEAQVIPSPPIAVSTDSKPTVRPENAAVPVAARVAPPPKPETPNISDASKPETPNISDAHKRSSSDGTRETDKPNVTKRKAESAKTASVSEGTRREKPPAISEEKKVADESKAISSGGGERPRRVKPQGDSQGTSTPKPKVIEWP